VTRSGFVALAGRPNAGKSTLVNRIVGDKVAIVSDKPQTTRREIRGIATGPDWQLVLVDLPGVQRPRDPLTERMQRRVESVLADSDAVLFVLNGEQRIGPGDRFIAAAIAKVGVPAVTALNKVDRLNRPRTVTGLDAAAGLGVDGEVFPISARSGAGVEPLVEHLVELLAQRHGRGEVVAERLLDHHHRVRGQAGPAEAADHVAEQRRRDLQIEQGGGEAPEPFLQLPIQGGIMEVPPEI